MRRKNVIKRKFISFFCAFSAALVLGVSVSAQERVSIDVRPEMTLENEIVRLGDIAEISEGETSAKLKAISLGYAPNIGAKREISREQLRLAISAAGFSENDFLLLSPAKILIRRAEQQISPAQIRETVEAALLEKLSAEKIEARIVRFESPETTVVPRGEIEIRPHLPGIQNYFQPFSLAIEIRVNGKTTRRFAATVEIEAFAEVLVAARDLTADAKITDADVRSEKRRLERPLAAYAREAEKLRGLTLVKNLAAGTELTTDTFVSGVVIKYGDSVRIEAISGKVKIIVSGQARSSGKIGDRVAVKNAQSGAILQAVVVDEGLVRINF